MVSNLVAFNRTYDETHDIIIEARNYMAYWELRENHLRNGGRDLKITSETMRVTTRLLQVMAWLMLVRAFQHGEIPMEEISRDCNRLSGQEVCLAHEGASNFMLPTGLQSLLDRSYALYQRVSRLEQMLLTHWDGGRGISDN